MRVLILVMFAFVSLVIFPGCVEEEESTDQTSSPTAPPSDPEFYNLTINNNTPNDVIFTIEMEMPSGHEDTFTLGVSRNNSNTIYNNDAGTRFDVRAPDGWRRITTLWSNETLNYR